MAAAHPIAPTEAQSRSFAVHAALRRFQAGKPRFADLPLTAEALGVPAWSLLIEGLAAHPELLKDGALAGLEGVVRDYLASDTARRQEIEVVARASVALSRTPGLKS